jgi:hypothetical protein
MSFKLDKSTPVYSHIETLAAEIPGWSPVDQLYTLFQLVYLTADLPGDIVEIGSWCGRSTAALGLAASLAGKGHVYAVDLFPGKDDWHKNEDGTYSFSVTINGQVIWSHHQQTVWAEPFERDIAPLYHQTADIRQIFSDTVKRCGLQEVVTAYRGTSEMFIRSMSADFRCRVAFIDAHHSYEGVCRDIDSVPPALLPGGWICFDDAFSHYEGVDQAIQDRILSRTQFDLAQQLTRKLFAARKQKS